MCSVPSPQKSANFEKNINYPRFDDPTTHEEMKNLAAMATRRDTTSLTSLSHTTLLYTGTMLVQCKRGVQLVVTKALSDELDHVDMQNMGPEDLVVMFPSMEIYFEDPALPTVLWFVKDAEYNRLCSEYFDVNYRTAHSDHFGFEYYLRTEQGFTCQLGTEMMRAWLSGGNLPDIPGQLHTEADEAAFQRQMFMRLAKLFTYCSIPQYAPLKTTRKQLHEGGKSGVRNRPVRPIYRVTVPSVVHPKEPAVRHSDGVGRHMAPHRRRGYLRKLVSEKFVNKKGTVVYVRPALIHGGSARDVVYVAVNRKKEDGHAVREVRGGDEGLAGSVAGSNGHVQERDDQAGDDSVR